ncbi:MAG: presqualene diphosphate synthase HpnD [Zoogloeaceae bacterium]|nr:presqualene diphosphate synthase HpnD [Zoogloeaceae bacterium]
MNPHDYCRRRTAASGSSFYYGFLCLPAPRRRAIMALYAFCREVDDVVDETADADAARVQLDEWRAEIARVYTGTPQHPVGRALAEVVAEFRLPEEQLLEIIDGMEMDLDGNRYGNFSQLQLYCYRVASVVGLLSAEIFGYTDRRTLRYAHDLGLAFQLTNILRDVGDDARRGRIYLPQDELTRFGVSEDDILAGRYGPQMTELLAFQADRAREFYERALGELPDADRRAQRPGLIMAAIYRRLLDDIVAGGYRVLGDPPRLTTGLKLKLAVAAFWQC